MVLPHERGAVPQPGRNESATPESEKNNITKGIGDDALASLATKGKYVPLDHKTSESIWGVVHLYRDAEDTPSLYDQSDLRYSLARHASLQLDAGGSVSGSDGGRQLAYRGGNGGSGGRDAGEDQVPSEDCTMLCILAVPLYLSPGDFLAIVGEDTRDAVSHFRMIRTSRANRYMVLMKFRSGTKAREWQKEWNGKVVNSLGVSLSTLTCFTFLSS
jgi:BRCA1-associated protein